MITYYFGVDFRHVNNRWFIVDNYFFFFYFNFIVVSLEAVGKHSLLLRYVVKRSPLWIIDTNVCCSSLADILERESDVEMVRTVKFSIVISRLLVVADAVGLSLRTFC